MAFENMETEVSSRIYRFNVDVNIEKDTQLIKHGLSFSFNNGGIWRINFEISPEKSEVILTSVPNPWRNALESYRINCCILNYQDLGLITFQDHHAEDQPIHLEFFKWNDVKKIQEDSRGMQVSFEFIDMSQRCNHVLDGRAIDKQSKLRMLQFFESGEYSDFLIKTEKKNFKVHKVVLAARSPVFAAMFRNRMKEAKTGVVSITSVRTVVMEELLRFMYADVTAKLSEMPCELFTAAHLYDVGDLERLCVEHMSTHICVENVIGILTLCDRYLLEEPKEAALKFVLDNEVSIVKRDEYLMHLMETVKIENVVDRLKLAQKYELAELKLFLLEFVATNYKDVIKDTDYREMYRDETWVSVILEVDEYVSNYINKVKADHTSPNENSINVFTISSIFLLLVIILYYTFM